MEFYDFPKNKNISPFEIKDGDNYFAEAGKISYLGNYEEIGNISTPFDERNNVLLGEHVLSIYKRYALVENGRVAFTNKKFDDGHKIGASRLKTIKYVVYSNVLHEYKIDSWGATLLKSYIIKNTDGSYNCSLQPRLFETTELAIQFAINVSQGNDMKCIVAQWFADIDRY